MAYQVVLDTNVLVAAMRSRSGASYAVLELLGKKRYDLHLSVPLVAEYRDVLARFADEGWYDAREVAEVIAELCGASRLHRIFFLWRPLLPDVRDDLVLELAIAAQAQFIVTHNIRHFPGMAAFGVRVITPLQLLELIGGDE